MLLRGRRVISAILRQAEARGEIASDQDWSLVTDVTTAMSLLQVIRGQRVDAAFVRQVIDTLVMPAIRR
jgi:predicted nucleotidyltransferase